ncbi:MAG: licC domain protein [Lachnospiraceae bacterium]|nr:licC domain protein [Lachnospiraceae bacterium]
MKILIVTVAGLSSRFRESLGRPCLKCLYQEGGTEKSLLYRMLHQDGTFDFYVIVGGFQYEELKKTIARDFQEFGDKILLVRNEHYADYGSGYSLYLGLKRILDMDLEEVIFAEGDLYVDRESFRKIYDSRANVITCNREAILADQSVAFYFDQAERVHYLYDTGHSTLEIPEPFLGIFNSGQIWKFSDADHLRQAFFRIREKDWQGTNLVLVQEYFGSLERKDYEIVCLNEWVNCNTVSDYRKIEPQERKTEQKTNR